DRVYPIDDMADDVVELLDALQLREPIVLGGLSMGGYVALSLALRYPARFRALVLMDTRASADTPDVAAHREAQARHVEETGRVGAVADAMLRRLFSPWTRARHAERIDRLHAGMVKAPPRAVVGALRGMAARPDRSGALGQIGVPTLVLVGEDDVITPPA